MLCALLVGSSFD